VHRLTKEQARRIAVRAQLLDAPRPTDLSRVVRRLTLLQIDPTRRSRRAPTSSPGAARLVVPARAAQAGLEEDRTLFELNALIRPMSDLGLYLAGADGRTTSACRGSATTTASGATSSSCSRSGPLTSRDIPDTCAVPWASTGWTNNRNVTQMLEFLHARARSRSPGASGASGCGTCRAVYPRRRRSAGRGGERIRNERRLAALGIARRRRRRCRSEPVDVGEAASPAVVEGVKGEWRVDPAYLDGGFEGQDGAAVAVRPARLRPRRAEELFDFEYTLEMYKPAAKRRWGYFALPILHGDRLVGKLDADADRKASRAARARDPRGRPASLARDHEGRGRRGLAGDLAAWLESRGVRRLISRRFPSWTSARDATWSAAKPGRVRVFPSLAGLCARPPRFA
jgi:hypothetical protein